MDINFRISVLKRVKCAWGVFHDYAQFQKSELLKYNVKKTFYFLKENNLSSTWCGSTLTCQSFPLPVTSEKLTYYSC